jgi:YspA, cpYpsA-related SLOG family
MKVIIAGSRDIRDPKLVDEAVKLSGFDITTVVSGGAEGVDKMGEAWARRNSKPVHRWPANWKQFGLKAGFLRNIDMAHDADALIAIWNGESRGTKHIIKTMKDLQKPAFVLTYPLKSWIKDCI